MAETKKLRAAVYARKSNDDKKGDASLSVEAQAETCLAIVKREGYQLVRDGANDYFADDGITGRAWQEGAEWDASAEADDTTNAIIAKQRVKRRPALGRLFRLIARGKIDVLVIRDFPRLARPVFKSDLENFIPRFLIKHKVSVFSQQDGFCDYKDEMKLIFRTIADAMIDRELRLRTKHSMLAVTREKSKGRYFGPCVPFGYSGERKPGGFKQSEYAVVVRNLFHDYLKTTSLTRLSAELQERGIPTPSSLNPNRKNHAKFWGHVAVRKILQSPIYAGYIRHDGQLINCKFKYSLEGADSTVPIVGDKVLRLVDAGWTDETAELDVTDRGADGFTQTVPGLRTLSVTAKLIYDPTNSSFNDIYQAYGERKSIVISMGNDREDYFTMIAYVASFSISQNLTETMIADLTLKPTRGGFNPAWVMAN